VVLYEILSGGHPFRGRSEEEILALTQVGGFPPIAKAAPDTPAELCDIIDRCMSPEPDGRPPDAGRAYEELISFLYTTGRRVGVHDLGVYIQTLREPDATPHKPRGGDRTLQEAFSDRALVTPQAVRRTEATPVERPKSATPPPVEIESGARALPTELRDVTVIAWEQLGEAPPTDAVAELNDLIERLGGHIADTSHQGAVALFGLERLDGRDTESAISCGLKLQRLAASLRVQEGIAIGIGIGVHAGKVVVDPLDSRPREDTRYADLVDEARALAARLRESGVARR
jgi:hypothetical protein